MFSNNKQTEIYSNQSNDDDIDNMLKLESQKPKPTASAPAPPPMAADDSDNDDFVSGDEDEGNVVFTITNDISTKFRKILGIKLATPVFR